MSDMLAVLLGAGGSGMPKALAALTGGKFDASDAPVRVGGEDPFMEVLFSRLNAAEEGGLPSSDVDGMVLKDAPAPVPGLELEEQPQIPLNPLALALFSAHRSAVDDVEQAPQTAQAAQSALLLVSVAQGATGPEKPGSGKMVDVDMEVLDSSVGAHGVRERHAAALANPVVSNPAASTTAAKLAADPTVGGADIKVGAAGVADEGQLLPNGRGGAEVQGQLLRAGGSQFSSSFNLTAAQLPGVSASAEGTESVTVAAGLTTQAMPAGTGYPVGDVQGRVMSGSAHLSVDAPVRSPLFSQELGERIVWLSARQGQVADIALNPPHLGPLEVKLSLTGGEAGAQFFSPHPQVREAIEAALPRLREMLAEAGVTLGQAQVRDEAFPRQGATAQDAAGRGSDVSDEGDQVMGAAGFGGTGARALGLGLVDTFA